VNDQWTRRVWPPAEDEAPRPASHPDASEDKDDLPPSAVWYGTPIEPPRRMPRWLQRLLLGWAVLAVAAALISAVVFVILNRADTAPPTMVADTLAGVSYSLPPEWTEGVVAPVTGFTSVAARGERATVMARPEEHVDAARLGPAVADLSNLYTRLLLHGDKIDVVEDHDITINGMPAHTRAVRAEYSDVVNQPAFMRVTLVTRPDGKTTVLLGLAHPDDPRSRADIDAIMSGVR
jgi:hypothetical protein